MTRKRERMKRPAPLSSLMASQFSGTPVRKRLEEGRIWLIWDDAVGAQIAAKACPVSFRDGMLTVAVANSPWMQQLTFLKQGIVDKLNELLGCDLVRDIFLKSGRVEAPVLPAKAGERLERPLDAAEKLLIAEQSAAIEDPDLREALAHLIERHTINVKSSR
jgi:hypothetical protein